MHNFIGSPRETDLSERVRSVLLCADLTLSKVSRSTESQFGRSSPFFVPHTFYYQLRLRTFSPSVQQIFALSQISGFRFADWTRLFGFDMEAIPRVQALLPARRTVLIDSSWADSEAWVPWVENRTPGTPKPHVAPLAQLLKISRAQRIRSLSWTAKRHFLYAKVGQEDALAFPDVLPGSIVRVNPTFADDLVHQANGETTGRIFLIEHGTGLLCCRLRAVEDNVVVPVSTLLSYAQVELRIPSMARIVGVVDLEIRPLLKHRTPAVPRELARHWRPQPLSQSERLGELLRNARARMRISLREAAAMSRAIADLLGDDRFIVSPSSLHDYEFLNTAPRDFHKAIALCLVYGLECRTFLNAVGIAVDQDGAEPIPDRYVSRITDVKPSQEPDLGHTAAASGFLEELLAQCEEVPFFMRDAIGPFSTMPGAGLENCFWIGGQRDVIYPYLSNGLLVLVNHRRRKPFHFTSKPVWQQPVYMILMRDGTYQCACCSMENGTLVVHPYAKQFHRSERLRYHAEAEIIGQIVAVVRKLP